MNPRERRPHMCATIVHLANVEEMNKLVEWAGDDAEFVAPTDDLLEAYHDVLGDFYESMEKNQPEYMAGPCVMTVAHYRKATLLRDLLCYPGPETPWVGFGVCDLSTLDRKRVFRPVVH